MRGAPARVAWPLLASASGGRSSTQVQFPPTTFRLGTGTSATYNSATNPGCPWGQMRETVRTIKDEAIRNSENLQRALDLIFLSIGNAYYEANKASSLKASPSPVNVESNKQIRQSRAAFLDSLDQLEIIVMRTTEVLQAHARRQHPEIFEKGGLPIATGSTAQPGKEGPSPETMLLNGEGLLPSMQCEVALDPLKESQMAVQPVADELNGGTFEIPGAVSSNLDVESALALEAPPVDSAGGSTSEPVPALHDGLTTPAPDPNQTLDDDLMNFDGPIDFGDMDFDNFKFDDAAHFDFGSMMDD